MLFWGKGQMLATQLSALSLGAGKRLAARTVIVSYESLVRSCTTTAEVTQEPQGPPKIYVKRSFKNPFKRASAVMTLLEAENRATIKQRIAQFPKFNVGDAIEVNYVPEVNAERAVPIRGTVIGFRNRGLESSFRLVNAVEEDIYEAQYPFNTPMLKGIRVLQRNRVTDGGKAVRRNKLYFLPEKPVTMYAVSASTRDKGLAQSGEAGLAGPTPIGGAPTTGKDKDSGKKDDKKAGGDKKKAAGKGGDKKKPEAKKAAKK